MKKSSIIILIVACLLIGSGCGIICYKNIITKLNAKTETKGDVIDTSKIVSEDEETTSTEEETAKEQISSTPDGKIDIPDGDYYAFGIGEYNLLKDNYQTLNLIAKDGVQVEISKETYVIYKTFYRNNVIYYTTTYDDETGSNNNCLLRSYDIKTKTLNSITKISDLACSYNLKQFYIDNDNNYYFVGYDKIYKIAASHITSEIKLSQFDETISEKTLDAIMAKDTEYTSLAKKMTKYEYLYNDNDFSISGNKVIYNGKTIFKLTTTGIIGHFSVDGENVIIEEQKGKNLDHLEGNVFILNMDTGKYKKYTYGEKGDSIGDEVVYASTEITGYIK